MWNNQLVYQVTVLQDGVKNIYEVNAESGDIVCVVIDNEEAAAETPEAVESPAPQGQNTQTDSSSGGSYSNEIDFSDIDTWLNQGKKVVKSATSSGSVSSKINNVIRDSTFGRINLNLGW